MSYTFHAYQQELFPTGIRARAVGFVYSWSRFSAIFTGFAIAFVLERSGVAGVFVLHRGRRCWWLALAIGLMGPRTRNLALGHIPIMGFANRLPRDSNLQIMEVAMARFDLTDFEWSVISPLLPNKPRGVPRVDDRRVLNGIFWRLRTGAPWADIPRALRSAHDLRQPLQPLAQGRRLGSHSQSRVKGL